MLPTQTRNTQRTARGALILDIAHFRQRVLQDALTEATAQYWERRAAQFQTVGTAECDLIATNCRNHAQLLRDQAPEPISQDVIDTLNEVT